LAPFPLFGGAKKKAFCERFSKTIFRSGSKLSRCATPLVADVRVGYAMVTWAVLLIKMCFRSNGFAFGIGPFSITLTVALDSRYPPISLVSQVPIE